MMYAAFPLHGGLVEFCHTAAEIIHPAFGLFMKVVTRTCVSLLSALLYSHLFYSISVIKRRGKNTFH